MSPSFPSSCFAVRHHSNLPGAFLSTIPFQDARCGTAFPGNACPNVQDWGKCASFRAKAVEVSGHLPHVLSTFKIICTSWTPTRSFNGYIVYRTKSVPSSQLCLQLSTGASHCHYLCYSPLHSCTRMMCLLPQGCLDLFNVC